MQLARVDPGLAQPHALHQLDHGARTLTLAFALLQLLVVGVAANAPIAASPRHAWTAASAIARSMRGSEMCLRWCRLSRTGIGRACTRSYLSSKLATRLK